MQTRDARALRLIPALLCFIFIVALTEGSAQSLGELARQERERIKARRQAPARVFTNEDLARPKILDGSERGSIAREPVPSSNPLGGADSPAIIPPAGWVVPIWPEGTPLGDIARYYKQRKQQQDAAGQTPVVAAATSPVPAPEPQLAAPQRSEPRLAPAQPSQKPRNVIVAVKAELEQGLPAASTILVSPGDSLWKLAERYLGNGNQWREIAAANPEIADPNRIFAGQQLRLPGNGGGPGTAESRLVRVQAGDSLWKIAKAQWGIGQAWSCIAEANPQIEDFSRIYPGQTLTLPTSCSPAI